MKIRQLFMVGLLMSSLHAYAIPIEADLNTPGDGLITRDSNTNLEWLDVSLSDQGVSYVAEQLALGEDGAFAGFRWATTGEFLSLILDNTPWTWSQVAEVGYDLATFESLSTLFGLLGVQNYSDGAGLEGSWAFNTCDLPNGQPSNNCRLSEYGTFFEEGVDGALGLNHTVSLYSPSYYYLFPTNDDSAVYYQLLVRSVPEPGSLSLLVAGLLAMGLLRRPVTRKVAKSARRCAGDRQKTG